MLNIPSNLDALGNRVAFYERETAKPSFGNQINTVSDHAGSATSRALAALVSLANPLTRGQLCSGTDTVPKAVC